TSCECPHSLLDKLLKSVDPSAGQGCVFYAILGVRQALNQTLFRVVSTLVTVGVLRRVSEGAL
ncbi:hypothetical protein, partial [Oceanimonas doudoroffii]|uniref:hypothetical protein n=1 Tax=Oceanimonas doudoroffii TaxID=84158 RepID=UPI001B804C35